MRPHRRGGDGAAKPGERVNLTIQMLSETIGMALCSAVFTVAGSFRLVFLVTGAVVLPTLPIAWRMIERPVSSAAASRS